jgi:DMSO/TMAO reductase YedYZ molybdopterin-dependent catalytic subunit
MASSDDPVESGTPVGRRLVLGMLGIGVLGVVAGRPVADAVGGALASSPVGDVLPGAGGFRYYSVVGSVPPVSDADYRLTVAGHVRAPLTLTMSDLAALPQTSLTRDFQCVTGWRVPGVAWSGVLLRDVLAAAGARAGAGVELRSFDGEYTESLTADQARRDDVLVATAMLGAPVTHDHGGPVRLLVAPMYGYKSLKWLGGIEVVDAPAPGYWERAGYDVDAWVGSSNGRRDDPV